MSAPSLTQQLLREGRVAESEQLCGRILRDSPDDLEALNITGLAALRRGDLARARELLMHAVSAHPHDAHSHYHLGRVCDEQGDLAAARRGYEDAVGLDASLYTARLHLGWVLDRCAEPQPALAAYVRALADAQSRGRWLDPASTPAALRPLVERAVRQVLAAKRQLADEALGQLSSRYGTAELARISAALRVYLREAPPAIIDPRQQPTVLHIPGLPASAYLPPPLFPWLCTLEALTPQIRAELRAVLGSAAGRERVFHDAAVESANLRGTVGAPSWNGYYFHRHGQRREGNCSACPLTAAALDELPLARIPGYGPEVLYSVFSPGTHLLPHRGVTNARLVAHLPLIVPADCSLVVGGERHDWQEGRIVVFDDTYEHEAWNRGDGPRVVLIFDVWNPHLTEVERAALTDLLPRMNALQPLET